MSPDQMNRTGNWLLGLGCLIPVVFVIGAGIFHGCSGNRDDGTAQQQSIQQSLNEGQKEFENSHTAQLAVKYSSSRYDALRQVIAAHFRQNPDVLSSDVDETADTATGIKIILRPGVSDERAIAFARRVARYMRSQLHGDETYICEQVEIHHHAQDSEYVTEFDREAKLSNVEGMIICSVFSGMGDTDQVHDPTWHLIDSRSGHPVELRY